MRFSTPCRSKSRVQTGQCPAPECISGSRGTSDAPQNANFRGMSSSPCQKSTNYFSKENNVDFPGAKTQDETPRAGRTLLKNTQAPTDQDNGRAGRALDRWGTCAGDRKRPLRTGRTLDREGRGNRRLGARPREGRRLFHPSIPKNRHGRARAGRTPGFSEAHEAPALSPLCGGQAQRRGRAGAPGLFVPCCSCAETRRETPKDSRPAGTAPPGIPHGKLSAELPA